MRQQVYETTSSHYIEHDKHYHVSILRSDDDFAWLAYLLNEKIIQKFIIPLIFKFLKK